MTQPRTHYHIELQAHHSGKWYAEVLPQPGRPGLLVHGDSEIEALDLIEDALFGQQEVDKEVK